MDIGFDCKDHGGSVWSVVGEVGVNNTFINEGLGHVTKPGTTYLKVGGKANGNVVGKGFSGAEFGQGMGKGASRGGGVVAEGSVTAADMEEGDGGLNDIVVRGVDPISSLPYGKVAG